MTIFPFKIKRTLGSTNGRPSFLRRPYFIDELIEIEIFKNGENKTKIEQAHINLLSDYFLFLIGLISKKEGKLNRFDYIDYNLGFNVEIIKNDFIFRTLDGFTINKISCWEALQATFKELNTQINIAIKEERLEKSEVLPLLYYMPFYLDL